MEKKHSIHASFRELNQICKMINKMLEEEEENEEEEEEDQKNTRRRYKIKTQMEKKHSIHASFRQLNQICKMINKKLEEEKEEDQKNTRRRRTLEEE